MVAKMKLYLCRRVKWLYDLLHGQGYQTQWQSYVMPHSVLPEQLADISAWLQDRLM